MAYINSTRTVVNNVGTDIALAGAGNLFTVSGSLGGTKSLTLSDGFINNGAPEANLIVPLLFPNGHNDLGPSLYLEITVAGVTNPIPVVSNQNGTLAPIPHHEMTEGGSTVYKVVDPNTILNVYYTADYDGSQNPAFVVVGNPLVLSSSTYSIYANGWNDTEFYSTNEVKTNKVWIDGKPIYRKVYDGLSISTMSGNTFVSTNIQSPNVDTLINSILLGSNSVSYYSRFHFSSANVTINNNTGNLDVWTGSNGGTVKQIILEYTKTTD